MEKKIIELPLGQSINWMINSEVIAMTSGGFED